MVERYVEMREGEETRERLLDWKPLLEDEVVSKVVVEESTEG